MKRIFFTLIMAAWVPLMALPNEAGLSIRDNGFKQVNHVQNDLEISDELEAIKNFSTSRDCKNCPPGPRGARGPEGPTGPTGPTGSEEIVDASVYGSFFTTDSVAVTDGSPILFTSGSDANRGVSLDPSGGVILLSQPGDYLVIFGVSASRPLDTPVTPTRYALTVNDVIFAAGSNVDSMNANQMTTVSTTVRVPATTLSSRLSVINFGIPLSFTLSSATPADLTAFIVVKRLNSLVELVSP